MKSIRASLIIGSVLGTIAIFSLAGVAVYRGARSALVRQLDESLAGEARVIASIVKETPDGLEAEIEDMDIPRFTSPSGHGYLQIWLDPDSVIYRSPRLGDGELEHAGSPAINHPALRWLEVGGGVHVRAVDLRTYAVVDPEDWEEVHAVPPKPRVIRLVAAEEANDVETFLAHLRALLIAVGGLGGLAVAFVLATVVRRSLRPLDDLAREIAGLSDDDLSARVRLAAMPREVEPVVEQLNQLLERLDEAFLRERTFTSDIAHELRTPLAGLRSTLEVTASRPRSEGDYRETLEGLMVIVRRMQSMVETLLYLGRLDAGQVEVEERTVDSRELLKTTWEALAERARTRRISLVWAVPDEFSVTADPVLLEVAVRNLLDNAVTYADDAGTIRIEATTDGDTWVVRVANTGSRIPQERVGELLRRFTRADPARPASGEHFGLGLALTSRILLAMGTEMEITTRVGGEFAVSFRLPRAAAESS